MAHIIDIQNLQTGPQYFAVKVSFVSDGSSGELKRQVIFDMSSYAGNITDDSLMAVKYGIDGFGGFLEWDGGGINNLSFIGSGLNDLTAAPSPLSGTVDKQYAVVIDATGTPDTFKWSDDGGQSYPITGVAITGAAQTLNNGVTITFGATTGHTLDDKWDFNYGSHRHLISLPNNYADEQDYNCFAGGIHNNAGQWKTGDILLSTDGFGDAGDTGHILLHVKQKSRPITR